MRRQRFIGLVAAVVVFAGCRGDRNEEKSSEEKSSEEKPSDERPSDERPSDERPSEKVAEEPAARDLELPEVTAALPLGDRPADFRLSVHGNPLRADLDTAGWETVVERLIEAERELPASERNVTYAAMGWRQADKSFRLDKTGVSLATRSGHLVPEVYELLDDAYLEHRQFTIQAGHDDRPVLALAVAPEVAMPVVHDVVFSATRAGIHGFELLVKTPAGPARIPMKLESSREPHDKPCRRVSVTLARDGAFVSMANETSSGPRPAHLPVHHISHRMLLNAEGKCPTVAAGPDGTLDLDALAERIAKVSNTNRCPSVLIAAEGDVTWGTAAPVLARLAVEDLAPAVALETGTSTDCSNGVRAGEDPGG